MNISYRIYNNFELTKTQIRYLLEAWLVGNPTDLEFNDIWDKIKDHLEKNRENNKPISLNSFFYEIIKGMN